MNYRHHPPKRDDLARAYMDLLLLRAWDAHATRLEAERQPEAEFDAKFLKQLGIQP
jgi:hypothetical protein